MTFEIKGAVFFGSSLHLLSRISEEIGITATPKDMAEVSLASPRRSGINRSPIPPSPNLRIRHRKGKVEKQEECSRQATGLHSNSPPDFVVLDLSQVSNLDASASRGCFLQLAKMCAKRNIVLCAAGANPR
eukprot:708912-Ditylum_brightwellii.AAC.1